MHIDFVILISAYIFEYVVVLNVVNKRFDRSANKCNVLYRYLLYNVCDRVDHWDSVEMHWLCDVQLFV